MSSQSIGSCFFMTFRECCLNPACAPFFLLAALFYSFYYCWPYSAQLPEHIKVAIVDEDHSPLSRRLLMDLRATPRLHVMLVTEDREVAVDEMQKGGVSSIIGIPPNYERDILNGIPTALSLLGNGAFIVKARSSASGLAGPLEQITSEAVAAHLARHGASASALEKTELRSPGLVTQYMFNTLAGYLNFVAPIVFVVIFQTLMICGAGMLLNEWFCRKELPPPLLALRESPVYLMALQLPVAIICFFWCMLVEGAIFAIHGINSFQNIIATIAVSLCFSCAIGSLAILIGLALKASRFVIQAVVTSSIPCVFITGNIFPAQNMPFYMRLIAWFLPSTPGAEAMQRASQAGSDLGPLMHDIWHLLALWLLYSILALLVRKKSVTGPNADSWARAQDS